MDQNGKKTPGVPAAKKTEDSPLLKKRIRLIVIAAVLIAVGLAAYAVLRLTVLKDAPTQEQPAIGSDGETMQSGRPFVIEPLTLEQIQTIRVDNDYGGFCYYRGEDDQFYFEGAESLLYAEISSWQSVDYESLEDIMSSISVVDTLFGLSRYMLATRKIEDYNSDLSVYGLADNGQAAMTITYLDPDGKETEETVCFGYLTPSGDGYYVRKAGRDAVYIISAQSVTRCIYVGVNAYLLPQVAPSVSTASAALVSTFSIKKNGKEFLAFRAMTQEEFEATGEVFSHVMTCPAGYYPSVDDLEPLFDSLASFSGNSVEAYTINDRLEKLSAEDPDAYADFLHFYSLLDSDNEWVCEVNYEYPTQESFNGFNITLFISEKLEVVGEEGGAPQYVYNVYSPAFDVIVQFSADDLPWVEWDLLQYMDNHIFATSIDQVSEITFSYTDENQQKVNQTYYLTDSGQELKVTASNGVAVETDNFRQLYKGILYTTVDGYAEAPEEMQLLLAMNVKLRNGTSARYVFYNMTASKAYYTLNGEGEFYINRDYVRQIIAANRALMRGEEVSVARRN